MQMPWCIRTVLGHGDVGEVFKRITNVWIGQHELRKRTGKSRLQRRAVAHSNNNPRLYRLSTS